MWKRSVVALLLIAVLSSGPAIPAAGAGIDIGAIFKVFGIGYVVDMLSEQLNTLINKATFNNNVSPKDTTKVVPIVSVGTGAYVGAAQVSGPANQVKLVQAVGQIEGEFFEGFFRAKILVPLDSKNPFERLRRVPLVGVSAILDLRVDAAPAPAPAPAPPSQEPPTQSPPAPNPPKRTVPAEPRSSRTWEFALLADGIKVEGHNHKVYGNIHANDGLELEGKEHAVRGTVEAREFEKEGKGHSVSHVTENAPFVGVPNVDFGHLRASAQRIFGGNKTFSGNIPLAGIYYVEGDVTISGTISGSGAIVTRGKIRIVRPGLRVRDGSSVTLVGGNGIRVEQSGMVIEAILWAPDASVHLEGSGHSVRGQVLAKEIKLEGQGHTVIYDSRMQRSLSVLRSSI